MTSLDYDSLQILRQDLMIGELHKGRVSRGNGQNTFHVGNLSVWSSTWSRADCLRYSPLLFANHWMAETGISMEQINENPS